MKTKLKADGYGKFSRKRQRLLDSDEDLDIESHEEKIRGGGYGLVSLGAGAQNK